MEVREPGLELKWTTRRSRLKDAILASFREPAADFSLLFGSFNERDWRGVMRWLDFSGLALYFLDRVNSLGAEVCIPKAIFVRLQRNLEHNRRRTVALFEETVVIASRLKEQNVSFALLKGITLSPEPIADISLRCQMDIDILIRSSDAIATRNTLRRIGYELHSIKGQEWVFAAGGEKVMGKKELYEVRPQKMVEIHLLSRSDDDGVASPEDRLTRAHPRVFQGFQSPALSPPDQFVQQGLHILRHLCGEHTRAQWLLEYWWFVRIRSEDVEFWKEVEAVAATEPNAALAIGVAILLATRLFGKCAPPELAESFVGKLPIGVRLWVETYGHRVLTSVLPPSKFYMLLREQLSTGRSSPRSSNWRFLLPFHWWPTPISHGRPGERFASRLSRYASEVRHVLERFQFHVWTSIPFAIESLRWRKMMAERKDAMAAAFLQSQLGMPPDRQ